METRLWTSPMILLSIPQNIVMDLNNAMSHEKPKKQYHMGGGLAMCTSQTSIFSTFRRTWYYNLPHLTYKYHCPINKLHTLLIIQSQIFHKSYLFHYLIYYF